ncbi:MAG: HK97 gp10 family phage protein [Sulfurimonas sp.]|nr:HK97 gp10 family phage protein [Sulfurimonas sp.]
MANVNGVDVKVSGVEDLLRKLKSFPIKFQKNVITGAIRAGAAAITKEARRNVPRDDGYLKKSLKTIKRKTKDKSIIKFSVVPHTRTIHKVQDANGEKRYNYGGHIEFGSSKAAAHPYLRPAFESKGSEAIEIAKKYMKKRIDREVAKL